MMARQCSDNNTLDLLNWEPPEIVERFDEQAVRAATLKGRIAHAVALALKETDADREEIAWRMSEFLGEEVSHHVLNAYASEAKDDHTISVFRLAALIHATGDMRLLQFIAEMFGWAVIDVKYLAAVEEAMCADVIESTTARMKAARRRWKGGRP